MKTLLAVSLFCLLTTGSAQVFQCPRDGAGDCVDGVFAHPTECFSFYSCFDCFFFKQRCPNGLHFSQATGSCLRPEEALCGVSTTNPPNTTATTTPYVSTTSGPTFPPYSCPAGPQGGCLDGTFPNPYDCTKYYQCVNCLNYLRDCPPPLHFSPVTGNCIQQDVAMCIATPLPTPIPTSPPTSEMSTSNLFDEEELSLIFQCPSDGAGGCQSGNFPNPTDCTRYWVCANCLSFAMQCPAGLHFSPITQNCIRPEQAQCQVSTPGVTTPATTPTTSPTTPPTTKPTTPPTTSPTTSPTTPPTTSPTTPPTTSPTTPPTTSPTTPPTTSPTNTPSSAAIVGVARTSELYDAADPVPFNRILANVGGHFNEATNIFTPPREGVYFFSFSAGAEPRQEVNYNLRGLTIFTDILRASTSHNGADTLSKDAIARTGPSAQIRMTTDMFTALFSDAELQTSFNVFGLNDVMTRPLVAFSAGRTMPYVGSGILAFPYLVENSGAGWGADGKTFTAPRDGIYYFSVSTGAQPGYPQRVQIKRNGQRLVELYRSSSTHDGQDTLTRATLVQLFAGDAVNVELKSGYLFSDGSLQTSFSGFLYEPVSAPSVAWSVNRISSWTSSGSDLYPVNFGVVSVNTNNVYDTSRHKVVVPVSGYYFIHLDVGARPVRQVNFDLVLNDDQVLADIYRDSIIHNGIDTLGRGIIVQLSAGSTLGVRAAAGTALYSDSDMQTSFSGFLIATA